MIALVSDAQTETMALSQFAQESKIEAEQKTETIEQSIDNISSESPVAQKFAATQTIRAEGERRLKEGSLKESVALFQEAKTRAGEVNALIERSREQPRIARILREQEIKIRQESAHPSPTAPSLPLPSSPPLPSAATSSRRVTAPWSGRS